MIDCGNTLSVIDLFRLTLVDPDGNPYLTCENAWLTFEDLFRMLLNEDDFGNPAIAIYND